MRFHLLGLAHLPTSKLYGGCAFTQKNVKLARMLTDAGHEVFLYGARSRSGPAPVCTEFVETHTPEDIAADYGDRGGGDSGGDGISTAREEIGYDWRAGEFRHDLNGERKRSTWKYYAAAIREINARKRPDDFLLVTQGTYQQPIAAAVNLWLTCEPGIGYRGSWCRFRAFESAYIQNFTYGSEHPRASINGSYWDRVIPNYFDAEDVTFSATKERYFLYLGRLIARKGVQTAIQACNAIGERLLIAGQGGRVDAAGVLHGDDFTAPPGTWSYLGYADWERRKALLANARAVFCPTIYLEPFCGVHVEALLSGTPVITTDFGVFAETVINGENGYRCSMLADFVRAAQRAGHLYPNRVRASAERFLSTNVVNQYLNWFADLHQLYRSAHEPGVKAWSKLPGEKDPEPQAWERAWWGDCANTLGEEEKQLAYAARMGLEFQHDGRTPFALDLNGKSVIDIGGGPCSLLLKTTNGQRTVVDPCEYPDWVAARYRAAGIDYRRERGEDLNGEQADEAWLYNVLQHVDDPAQIVANARRVAKTVRVFEWIETRQTAGHPHVLTAAKLSEWFGAPGKVETVNERGAVGLAWSGVFPQEVAG